MLRRQSNKAITPRQPMLQLRTPFKLDVSPFPVRTVGIRIRMQCSIPAPSLDHLFTKRILEHLHHVPAYDRKELPSMERSRSCDEEIGTTRMRADKPIVIRCYPVPTLVRNDSGVLATTRATHQHSLIVVVFKRLAFSP